MLSLIGSPVAQWLGMNADACLFTEIKPTGRLPPA